MNLLPPNSGTDPQAHNPNLGYVYVVPQSAVHPSANFNIGVGPSTHFHPQGQFHSPAPQFQQQVNAINIQIQQVNPNQFNPTLVQQQLPQQQQQHFQGFPNFPQYQQFVVPGPIDPNLGAQIDIDQSNAQLDPAFNAPSPLYTVECTTSPSNATSDSPFAVPADDPANNPQGQLDATMGSILSGQHAQGFDGKPRSPKPVDPKTRRPLSAGQQSVATIGGGLVNDGFAVPRQPAPLPGQPRPNSLIVTRPPGVQGAPNPNQLDPRYVYGQLSHFIIEKKIGKGQFSVVYRARNVITNTITALKKVQVLLFAIPFSLKLFLFLSFFSLLCVLCSCLLLFVSTPFTRFQFVLGPFFKFLKLTNSI